MDSFGFVTVTVTSFLLKREMKYGRTQTWLAILSIALSLIPLAAGGKRLGVVVTGTTMGSFFVKKSGTGKSFMQGKTLSRFMGVFFFKPCPSVQVPTLGPWAGVRFVAHMVLNTHPKGMMESPPHFHRDAGLALLVTSYLSQKTAA